MSDKLKSVKYNGCYFDRREAAAARLCTAEGWFSCQVGAGRPWCGGSSGAGGSTREGGSYGLCVAWDRVWQGGSVTAARGEGQRKGCAGDERCTLTAAVVFYRGLSTALTARASIPSTPTATGKAESSSAPGISITCTYQVLIQTYLFRAPLRQARRPEDRSQCYPSFLLCLCSGFLSAEAHPSSR